MKNNSEKIKNKIDLKYWQGILVLLFVSGVILLLEMNLMPGGIMTVLRTFWAQKDLPLLNYFPLAVFALVFYLLMGNPFYAGALTTIIWGALSYANLLKIDGRDDALTPNDIALIREAANAVSEYKLDMHWDKVIPFVILIAVLIFLGVKCKGKKGQWKVRIPAALVIAGLFCYMVAAVYTDKDRYYDHKVETRYNVALEFNTLGFNYCFLYNYNLYPVTKPEDFNRSDYDALSASCTMASPEIKPNIIFVMCEAFSDLADEDMFDYTEENSPLHDWHTVCSSPNAFSGKISVSNYAAGTANTEFNILSGMQTNSIGEGLTSSFRTLHNSTVSIASILHDDGYDTFFMHPGKSWFYNRHNVYHYFGMDDQIFEEAFDDSDYKGIMISDEAFLDELLYDFKSRLEENDAPLFTYAVTIENHQAYNYGKFDFEPEAVPLTMDVSDAAKENLAVYMEGVRDTASMALRLTEYADSLDEPAVLVIFGDHRPNLGNTYEELGLNFAEGGAPATYEVPYVIYLNENYAPSVSFDVLGLEEGSSISDNYLGAMVLELTGYGDNDPYMSYLNRLRREFPVYRLSPLQDAEEVFGADVAKTLHEWTYYRIKY